MLHFYIYKCYIFTLQNTVYDINLTKNELCTLDEINTRASEGKKYFYIFDDFIGRGDQLFSLLIDNKLLNKLQLSNPNIIVSFAFSIALSKGYQRISNTIENKVICIEMINNNLYDVENIEGVFWFNDSDFFSVFSSQLTTYNNNFYKIDIINNEPDRTHYSQNIPFLFFHCTPPSSVRLFWDDDTISSLSALKKRITREGKN